MKIKSGPIIHYKKYEYIILGFIWLLVKTQTLINKPIDVVITYLKKRIARYTFRSLINNYCPAQTYRTLEEAGEAAENWLRLTYGDKWAKVNRNQYASPESLPGDRGYASIGRVGGQFNFD
jgi:hypothetical protein